MQTFQFNPSFQHSRRKHVHSSVCLPIQRQQRQQVSEQVSKLQKELSHQSDRDCSAQSSSALQAVVEFAGGSSPGLFPGFVMNTLVYILGIKVLLKGLTPAGVLHSWLLGGAVYSAFGFQGYVLVCLYFLIGNKVTKLKLAEKESKGIAEQKSGKRGPGSVWGSGIAGVACAVCFLLFGADIFRLGFVASFGSKLSDTVSSEVGKAYGKTTYLVTNFKLVEPGTEGAVSLEGTAAGAAAALLYGALSYGLGQVSLTGAVIATIACVVANFFESYLGATVQSKVSWLSNDVINMIQISVASLTAMGIYKYLL